MNLGGSLSTGTLTADAGDSLSQTGSITSSGDPRDACTNDMTVSGALTCASLVVNAGTSLSTTGASDITVSADTNLSSGGDTTLNGTLDSGTLTRSEERRVGKEGRSRGSPDH